MLRRFAAGSLVACVVTAIASAGSIVIDYLGQTNSRGELFGGGWSAQTDAESSANRCKSISSWRSERQQRILNKRQFDQKLFRPILFGTANPSEVII